jgi:hypothetical protein
LVAVHEIFGHGRQAINKMLGPDRIQNWRGGILLGGPTAVEADAITIRNMYALQNGLNSLVQKYDAEVIFSTQNPKIHELILHEIPWGFLLGTPSGTLFYYPEPK